MNTNRPRFHRLIVIAAVVLSAGFLDTAGAGQLRFVRDSLYAPCLHRLVRINLIVPESGNPRRHPVMYLLHGWGGNRENWTDLTGVTRYAQGSPFLIVMTDAENSWYVNAVGNPASRYEDFFTGDLPRFLAARYQADTTWQAATGLSMGGYGALMLAFRHHDRIRFAGAMSAGLDIPSEIDSMEHRGRAALLPSVLNAFGEKPGIFREGHDNFKLVRAARSDSLLYIYLVTGINEVYKLRLLLHRRLADSLRVNGIRYEYHETPGGHNFTFWDRELPPILRRAEALWRAGTGAPETSVKIP